MRHKLIRIAAIPVTTVGLMAIAIPFAPANAIGNDYQDCASDLSMTEELDESEIAIACAAALRPGELSACVTEIDAATRLSASAALEGCRRVRRPDEMSECVIDISATIEEAVNPVSILDHCRRSLLPGEFSNCVLGLTSEEILPPEARLETCLAGRDGRIRDFPPSFVPQAESELRLTPLVPTTPSDAY